MRAPRAAEQQEAPLVTNTATYDPGPTPGSIGWLWPEETATRGGGGGRWKPPIHWRYRALVLGAAVAIVLGGAGVAIGFFLHRAPAAAPAHHRSSHKAAARPTPTATSTPSAPPSAPPSVAPGGGLASNSTEAASWVTQQVAADTAVACDAQMCSALTASGFPVTQEVQLGVNSQSLSNAGLVVMTPTLSVFFNSVNPGLGSYVTPTVLASFGAISIHVIDPAGAAAYAAALNQDVQSRTDLGQQLMSSGQISASPAAQSELDTGQVDSRLLQTLQALADRQPIDVLGFTDSGPGASVGVPFRAMEIATTDTASTMTAQEYIQSLHQVLIAQTNAKLARVILPDGQVAVQIEYEAPSPVNP
jgi:hypothetical protein